MTSLTSYYSNKLSVPFTPVLPARMWYMAGYGVTFNAAGELTGWQDAGNNGFHLYPDGGKATLSPDSMNGHAMIRVVDRLATDTACGITGNMARSIYFLGRLVSGHVVVSCGVPGWGKLCECMQVNTYPILHAWGNEMSNFGKLPAQPVNTPALWSWRYNGAGNNAGRGFCDFNAARGLEGGPAYMDTADTPFYMAWGAYYSPKAISTIDVLEVLVYDRFLNEQEDQQVRGYLGTKGGVPFI